MDMGVKPYMDTIINNYYLFIDCMDYIQNRRKEIENE